MFQRILLPLDGSKTAEKVLLFGQKEAKLHRATIILLRAIAPLRQSLIQVPSVVDNVYQQIENIALDYLENVAKKLQEEEIDIEIITKQGHPAQCILESANEQNCDLIIIGTHGETDSPRWRFGGIAGKIVKAKISIPLLIIPTN